jgi:hypothetical protein
MGTLGLGGRKFGMKWRVMLEQVGPDGIVGGHEVGGLRGCGRICAAVDRADTGGG